MAFEKEEDLRTVTTEIVNRINENTRRIRAVEQRTSRIETGFTTLEETVITQMSDLKLGLERISQKIATISSELNEIRNEIIRINKDINKSATKAELKQIETFIDIVNPITAKFVTKDELDHALEERIKK